MSRSFTTHAALVGLFTTGSLSLSLLGGCAPETTQDVGGPVAQAIASAAAESHVSRDLLVAIAAEEGGLRFAPHRTLDLTDHVQVAGYLELRHGKLDTLARAAALAGTTEDALVEDTVLATQMGAAVVAELGAETGASDSPTSWVPALEELSGLSGAARADYARRVLARLQTGGRYDAYAGEVVTLSAHAFELPSVAQQALGSTTPEYAGALWFDTSCTGKCNIGRNATVDTIVIHDTEGGWTASVATLQNDPGKSVHYIVDADGSRVGQFRPEADTTWHSGNAVYNARSVGIEHVGYAADAAGYADGLYATSEKLVTDIRTRHSVPVDRTHIIGHYQVPDGAVIGESAAPCSLLLASCETSASYGGASNHRDPGPQWQWCPYMQSLGGSCTCNDAHAHFNCTTNKKQAVRCDNGVVEVRTCASACVAQPSGEDDLCELATTPPDSSFVPNVTPSKLLGATSTDPGSMTIVPDSTDTGHNVALKRGSGCSTSGTPADARGLALIGLAVAALLRRRRVA
ncbi:MAG: N-acetylmuramoyl-L-alanine amidase [Polyangia bacterium]